MRQIQPHGPYRLLGACFGATVAFEMTRQLLDAGDAVAFLGLLDPSSLGGDLTSRPALSTPTWLKRGTAFGSFVARRLQLYREEMRTLGFRQRVQIVRNKLQLVGEVIQKRDVFRDAYREFNQRRVYDANLRALRRYKHEPLPAGFMAVEIFVTERRVGRATRNLRVDWANLVSESTPFHQVPGKDSGDMLRGDNAKAVATLLSLRLQHARQEVNTKTLTTLEQGR
jgi:thioesterase domain-containing protein